MGRFPIVVVTLAFVLSACASSSEPAPTAPPPPPPAPLPAQPEPPTAQTPTPPVADPTPVAPPAVTGPQAVDMRGYDTSCRTNDDCTLVRPSPCGPCGCTDTAIAAREEARFREAATHVSCAPPDPSLPSISCGGCPGYVAVCLRQHCEVRTH